MVNKLMSEMREAMKNKDAVKRDCLKMVLNKAREIAKDQKTEDVTDDMVVTAAKKEVKQLQQTLDSLKGHEDSELYKTTTTKKEMLEKDYIPAQLSEDALRVELQKFIDENGLKGMGKAAMKKIMPAFKDKADGKMISKLVSEMC